MSEPLSGYDASGKLVTVYGKAQFDALSLSEAPPKPKRTPRKRTAKK